VFIRLHGQHKPRNNSNFFFSLANARTRGASRHANAKSKEAICHPPAATPRQGVTVELSALFPEQLLVGVEIRRKVVEHVAERIADCGAVLPCRTCARLERIFVSFAMRMHFKKKNHRRRVSRPLLANYAHLLKLGGVLYTITIPHLFQSKVADLTGSKRNQQT
jgi:tRNA G46 methylase TrmB